MEEVRQEKKAVYKFELVSNGIIQMPIGAEVVSVTFQFDQLFLWAIVDTLALKEERYFFVQKTGQEFLNDPLFKYVGTAHHKSGYWVIHVFEKLRGPVGQES